MLPPAMNPAVAKPPLLLRSGAWLFLGLAACYQIALALAPLPYLVRAVTVDDTYLYLEIARNWVTLGFPTFDGQHPTSGFQPLWNFCLMGLAALIQDRVTLLRTACLVTGILNLLTAPLVLRLGKTIAPPAVGYVAMIAWTTFLFSPSSPNGMESALHGLLLGMACLVAWQTWPKLPQVSIYEMGTLGGWLGLNGLCRLDSGIVSAIIAALFAWKLLRGRAWAALGSLFFLPVLLMLGYFGVSEWYFGSATPISGRVKMYWAHAAVDRSMAEAASNTVIGTLRSVGHSFLYVSGGSEADTYPWLPILALLVGGSILSAAYRRQIDSRLMAGGIILLIHTAVVHFLLQHLGKSYWYYQPLRIWASLVVGHIALCQLPLLSMRLQTTLKVLLVLFACSFSIWRGMELYSHRDEPDPHDDARTLALKMGEWIQTSQALPPDARIASWNAGELGYFAEPWRVVNLDGLVQSDEFLVKVIGQRAWKEYLRDKRIHYLADFNTQDATQTYRLTWDRQQLFRGLIPFEQTRLIKQEGSLYLLDVRPWLESQETPRAE